MSDSIDKQVTAALRSPHGTTPPVLLALDLLGVRSGTLAERGGISASAVSRYRFGRARIPRDVEVNWIALLAHAYKIAIVALGEFVAEEKLSPTRLATVHSRLGIVRRILMELEK